jgi:hypothetical protein
MPLLQNPPTPLHSSQTPESFVHVLLTSRAISSVSFKIKTKNSFLSSQRKERRETRERRDREKERERAREKRRNGETERERKREREKERERDEREKESTRLNYSSIEALLKL